MARMSRRCRRSVASDDFDRRVVPRGCGRRVSLKRRSRMDSAASRKITLVGSMRLTDFTIAGSSSSCVPSRTSTTSAVRLISEDCPTNSAKRGINSDRQIVHAVVAQVLEGLEHGGLARSAHAGDDDQFTRAGDRRPDALPGGLSGLSFDSFFLGLGRAIWCDVSRHGAGSPVASRLPVTAALHASNSEGK